MFLILLLFLSALVKCNLATISTIDYSDIQAKCSLISSSTKIPHFLNNANLICQKCDGNNVDGIKSTGFDCLCDKSKDYYLFWDSKTQNPKCQKCPSGKVVSKDGFYCVSGSLTSCSDSTHLLIDADLKGTPGRQCIAPSSMSIKDETSERFKYCNNQIDINKLAISLKSNVANLQKCDSRLIAGIIPDTTWKQMQQPNSFDLDAYRISSSLPTKATRSGFFEEYLEASFRFCTSTDPTRRLKTLCESIKNMCAMTFFVENSGPMKAASTLGYTLSYPVSDRFYQFDKRNGYVKNEILDIVLTSYSPEGQFLGYKEAKMGHLMICPANSELSRAGFVFGTNFYHSCSYSVKDLMKKETEFLDPYLRFENSQNIKKLISMPVLIMNINENRQALTSDQWKLWKRMFLVDLTSGKPSNLSLAPTFVTYAKQIEIVVSSTEVTSSHSQKKGKISVPIVQIDYDTVDTQNMASDASVTIEFRITYRSRKEEVRNIRGFQYDLSVAMGSLCALAGLYAMFRCYVWTRRAGLLGGIDYVILIKLLLFAGSAVSNVFLLVLFCVASYFFIFYKNQEVFAIYLPAQDQENFLIIYLSIAFGLKCVEILHLLATQCTIDIFFIDWENTSESNRVDLEDFKAKNLKSLNPQIGSGDGANFEAGENHPIGTETPSIWRSFLVANEWAELQVCRRTKPVLSLLLVLFLLKVFPNLEVYSAADPLTNETGTYRSPHSTLLRFAAILLCYVPVVIFQSGVIHLFMSQFIQNKLLNFVDLCSVSNISVFILQHRQYGYYVHGKSPQGTAMVGIKGMFTQLQLERENLSPERGLRNSQQQTFLMMLDSKLRRKWESRPCGNYMEVNRMLKNFFNRAENDNQYTIGERNFFEYLFDFEYMDMTDRNCLFKDEGTSFGNVLFYGQEFSLATFEMALFCVVDLISSNFVLDATISWIVIEIVSAIRFYISRRNLSNKTMVDRRFLI